MAIEHRVRLREMLPKVFPDVGHGPLSHGDGKLIDSPAFTPAGPRFAHAVSGL
jgi:hypothetical protein